MEPVRAEGAPEQAEAKAADRAADAEDRGETGPVQVLKGSVSAPAAEKKYPIRQECHAIRLNVQNADNR